MKRVTAMIPIAKRVLLKDWAILPVVVVVRNVYLCHVLLSSFVAKSCQTISLGVAKAI